MNDASTSLDATLERVWAQIERGAAEKDAPANLMTLATFSRDRGATLRIIVLRGIDRSNNELHFFTHADSGKARDLKDDKRAELLIWEPSEQLQIRLSVTIELAQADDATWASLGPGTRLNYAVEPSPGTVIQSPDTAWRATPKQHRMLRLDAKIRRIETLEITQDGLKRAIFEGETSRWIAP